MNVPTPKAWVPTIFRANGTLRATYTVLRHFLMTYGWLRTRRAGRCVDASGSPLPWYSYPAIDYLRGLDFSASSVFEYGAGASTLFWAARARHVVSVESDEEWYRLLLPQLPANGELYWVSLADNTYAESIRAHGTFDVIIVDGPGGTRMACTEIAPQHLNRGGMIILDNSEHLPQCTAYLRDRDFLQVDMTGFAPIVTTAQSTSLFFARDAHFRTRDNIQPHRNAAQTDPPWVTV